MRLEEIEALTTAELQQVIIWATTVLVKRASKFDGCKIGSETNSASEPNPFKHLFGTGGSLGGILEGNGSGPARFPASNGCNSNAGGQVGAAVGDNGNVFAGAFSSSVGGVGGGEGTIIPNHSRSGNIFSSPGLTEGTNQNVGDCSTVEGASSEGSTFPKDVGRGGIFSSPGTVGCASRGAGACSGKSVDKKSSGTSLFSTSNGSSIFGISTVGGLFGTGSGGAKFGASGFEENGHDGRSDLATGASKFGGASIFSGSNDGRTSGIFGNNIFAGPVAAPSSTPGIFSSLGQTSTVPPLSAGCNISVKQSACAGEEGATGVGNGKGPIGSAANRSGRK